MVLGILGYIMMSFTSWIWVMYCDETNTDVAALDVIITILTLPVLIPMMILTLIVALIASLFSSR